ncbi:MULTISPECIES: H-NS histone family protein [Burkholderia]|jgi:DNA-binding protein H-NS|uniref:H-NS histone family protein n=2 Tax=Burkholderia cepacia complex TaxID=87882 RepID=A0A1E3FN34_9BURK|nr:MULTISPECIES: H-NS histone family protein [Burkholderia]ELK7724816.1 H-NS histone family protein [Burkholderia cenocepacia]UTP27781.1 H-NS histone family protein [Burkholderia sp. FXe9]HBN6128651.1 H-NS histone family protein [Clostridioides difficile]MBA9833448.1 H-NS histone family protein [Burkholderia contaminans]MBH9693723.1 H-NS histone family protein [Burkholderia contaminans]
MSTTSYKQLLKQREELEAEIARVRESERADAVAKIRELMEMYSISADELGDRRRTRKHKPVEAKYRDPDSGATWSGRGKPPRWIAGKDRESFAI